MRVKAKITIIIVLTLSIGVAIGAMLNAGGVRGDIGRGPVTDYDLCCAFAHADPL